MVGVVFFLEWLQSLQWSPHPQLLEVAWCSAIVVVVVVIAVQVLILVVVVVVVVFIWLKL